MEQDQFPEFISDGDYFDGENETDSGYWKRVHPLDLERHKTRVEADIEDDDSLADSEDDVAWVSERMFLEILRVNRAINLEASRLFFDKTHVSLRIGDVFAEGDNLSKIDKACWPTRCLWRHHPRFDPGKRDGIVGWLYASPPMGGDVEPHAFAKFSNMYSKPISSWMTTRGFQSSESWTMTNPLVLQLKTSHRTCENRLFS